MPVVVCFPLASVGNSGDEYRSLGQEYRGGNKDPVRLRDHHQNLPSQCKTGRSRGWTSGGGEEGTKGSSVGRGLVFDPLVKETGGH